MKSAKKTPQARPNHSAAIPVLVVLAVLGCSGCGSSPAEPGAPSERTESVVWVETGRVQRGSISQRVSAPGSLVARRESRIGAELQARISEVYVSEGDRVEAGQPLFQIDPEVFKMALRQAEAGLDLARAERKQLEADLTRAKTLRKQKVLAEQEIERLSTSLAVAGARERQAEEALELARFNLARTVVKAPYAGSVAARLADEGTTALVQPQTIVIILQEAQELEAQAAIPEGQLAAVRVGDRTLVHVEGVAEPIEANVSAVSDTIDPATRTYLVKMRVPNPDYRLKAGVFAHVEILPGAKDDALIAPLESVRTEEGRPRLLAVRDGEVVAVPVDIGLASENAVEIRQGVEEGEVVVVGEAARTIAPGMRVSIRKNGRESRS